MSSLSLTATSYAGAEAAFSVKRTIRFGQTDPAGIVYYPNYFNMFNELIEDWFVERLGMSFRDLHQSAQLGVPIVQLECQFKHPCRMGDVFDLNLKVLQLGSSSLHLRADGLVGDTLCVSANMVLVFVDLQTYRGVSPPVELRAKIEACLERNANDTI